MEEVALESYMHFSHNGAPVFIMATQQENACYVLQFAKLCFAIAVKISFRARYKKPAPCRRKIYRWYKRMEQEWYTCKAKNTGRPRVSEEAVNRIRVTFQRSPRKSTRRVNRALGLPESMFWRIHRKQIQMSPYRLHLLQALKEDDKVKRFNFCCRIMSRIENDDDFLNRLTFRDESTFHVSGKVNRHNVRIWGTETPHVVTEHERDSPKVNVFCAISRTRVFGPFFFAENI
jgi:hypothetical protein